METEFIDELAGQKVVEHIFTKVSISICERLNKQRANLTKIL